MPQYNVVNLNFPMMYHTMVHILYSPCIRTVQPRVGTDIVLECCCDMHHIIVQQLIPKGSPIPALGTILLTVNFAEMSSNMTC